VERTFFRSAQAAKRPVSTGKAAEPPDHVPVLQGITLFFEALRAKQTESLAPVPS